MPQLMHRIRLPAICLLLTVATIAAYEPMRHNGFTTYDDPRYVTENPHITGGITAKSLLWAFTSLHYHMWHPLTSLSHMLDCQLFGLNPLGHHFNSLILHIFNALLLFWVLRCMTGAVWPSVFVAAVFALHPLQVDSVAWVSERKNLLCTLFWILTVAAYVRYCRRPAIGRYIMVVLMLCLALMSKPTAVTLPLVLLLLDYWPLNRLRPATQAIPPDEACPTTTPSRLIVEKLPLLALSAAISVVTFLAARSGGAVSTAELTPLDSRIANAFSSYIKYLETFIWPHALAVYYPHPGVGYSKTAAAICALVLVVLFACCLYAGRQKRHVIVGWLWYLGTLVPVIGLVQAGAQARADRYMYIPMIGLLVMIAWEVRELAARTRYRQIAAAAIAAAILSAALFATRRQVTYWQNDRTLFVHALEVTENNHIAHNTYGCVMFDDGRLDDAVFHLSEAVRISPTFSRARINLGKVLFKQDKLDQAAACFAQVLQIEQDSCDALYNLGIVLAAQQRYDDAVKCFRQALTLNPDLTDARSRLAHALLQTGKPRQAIEQYEKVLQSATDRPDVYANLGNAYSRLGLYQKALSSWDQALRLKPDFSEVLNNLAWLLATTGDANILNPPRALELAQRACQLTYYELPELLDTLAAAYAAAGRFDDAAATAQGAIELAQLQEKQNLTQDLTTRLGLYLARKRYIEGQALPPASAK